MLIRGVVKCIMERKNFGFILHDKDEYFFHRADFSGHWDDLVHDVGTGKQITVQFQPNTTIKGHRANQVSRLDWPNQVSVESQSGIDSDSLQEQNYNK